MKLIYLLVILAGVQSARATVTFRTELEGIYDIKMKCSASSPACDPKMFGGLDRVTITDTKRPFGVWVTFANSTIHEITDTFTATDIGPQDNQLSGYPHIGNGFGRNEFVFSYVGLTIDSASETIRGSVVYAEDGTIYEFEGKKISILRDIAISIPVQPIDVSRILGTYRGKLGKDAGKLVISQLPDGNLLGSFSSDSNFHGAPSLTFTYSMNTYEQDLGILKLVFLNHRFFTLGEMAVSVSVNANNRLALDGFQFTGPVHYAVNMVKAE